MIQRTVGFGRGVLFCRWLTPETAGQWDVVYSFLLLAAPLAVLGVPGSFGRYLEHFRQRGHLQTFLRRTAAWTAVCSLVCVFAIAWWAPSISEKLFGSPAYVGLVHGTAICLIAIILHHTLTSLLTALRLFRVVSVMNFAQSLVFATVALVLLHGNASVASILVGYAVACLLSFLGALVWVWPDLRKIDQPAETLPHAAFWPRLLKFAFFVWIANLLGNLFAIADRYMIIHYSGLSSSQSLEQIGFYHSSRMLPMLLVSFADLLAGLVMPHLSHDWEAGRREQVGRRLNLIVKLTALGMLGVGVGVLLFAPLLFQIILQGKYADGLVVLPWTLAGCVWFAIFSVAQNYLWCAEKTRQATATLALGLGVNVALNLLLLPRWGLLGAVVATALSTGLCLVVILMLSRRHGMALDRGTWLVALLPFALAGGLPTATATLLVLLLASGTTNLVFSDEERGQLRALLVDFAAKLKPYWPRRLTATGNL